MNAFNNAQYRTARGTYYVTQKHCCGAGPFLAGSGSGYFFHRLPALAPVPIKSRLSTISKKMLYNIPCSLLEIFNFLLSITGSFFQINIETSERISFRISSVLSKVEPEPGAGPSHRLRLHNTAQKGIPQKLTDKLSIELDRIN